ncbi:MAG: hypothetical protein ACI9G1_004409 [Pirellulaceae bacterium]
MWIEQFHEPEIDLMEEETKAEKVGYFIGMVGIIFPSMIVGGFMPDWDVLPLWGWIAISGLSGGIGFAIAATPRLAAFFGGLVGGGCIPLAVMAYVYYRSQLGNTFFNIELLIPGFIGSLPGVGAYFLLARALQPWGDEEFESTNNEPPK